MNLWFKAVNWAWKLRYSKKWFLFSSGASNYSQMNFILLGTSAGSSAKFEITLAESFLICSSCTHYPLPLTEMGEGGLILFSIRRMGFAFTWPQGQFFFPCLAQWPWRYKRNLIMEFSFLLKFDW